jgi:small subunit ribosomal protein S16
VGPCFLSLFNSKQTRKNIVMALKIRLTRIGALHQPHYRVVIAEARSRRDGAPVETIGSYDPRAKANGFKVNLERVYYWMSKGALPTDTMHAMIKRARRAAPAAEAAAPVAV